MLAKMSSLLLLAACASANGAITLTADITNNQENPPAVPTLTTGGPRPASFGTGVFVLNDAQTQMTMSVEVFNIDFTGTQTPDTNDNLTIAHIHGGPAVTPATNGPVVWGFIGTPFNDTSPTDTVVTPTPGGVGATIVSKWDLTEGNNTTLTAQLPNIFAGRTYINFHTVQFGGGEIRGAILPEPGSCALIGVGMAGLLRRRR